MKRIRLVNIKNGKADLLCDDVIANGGAKCIGKIGTIDFKINSGIICAAINKKGTQRISYSMRIPFTLNENILHLLINDVIIIFGYEIYTDFDASSIEKEYEDIKMLSHSFMEYFESFIQ